MKTLNIPNDNNKLSDTYFLHITDAPKVPVLESELPVKVQICSPPLQPFEALVVSFTKCKAYELSSFITTVAAGMEREAYLYQYQNKKQSNTLNDVLAVYILKRL